MSDDKMTIVIEDAQIFYRNFAGKEGQYNQEGDRNFCVMIPEAIATQMAEDGWNVKLTEIREEGDVPKPFISVTVGYKIRPPRITMISSTARTSLDEESVEVLDWVNIKTVDLIARGSNWTVNKKSGIKAYLQTMYITIEEDELERKYATQD